MRKSKGYAQDLQVGKVYMYLVSIFGEKKKKGIGIYLLLYLSGHLLLDYLPTNALLKKMKNFFMILPTHGPFFICM